MGIVLATLAAVVAAPAVADDALAARRAEIARLQASKQRNTCASKSDSTSCRWPSRSGCGSFRPRSMPTRTPSACRACSGRYHEWLKTLTPSQRTSLAELEPSERVEEIRRIKKDQRIALERHQRVEVLSPSDMKEILAWTEDFVWQSKKTLMADMPKEYCSGSKSTSQTAAADALAASLRAPAHEGKGGLKKLEQQDIDRLAKRLSEPAQKKLAEPRRWPTSDGWWACGSARRSIG